VNEPSNIDASDQDATLAMISRLRDGSLSGLASYHLLRRDLIRIRELPETPH
jgi:hypothetical protein